MTAETLMLAGGIAAFAITFYWVRSRQLREKYAVMWMTVATALLLMGIFPRVVMSIADATRMAYSSMVLFLALGVIYMFSMSVSLSLTRSRRTSVKLMQDLALTRYELETLRDRMNALEQRVSA
ncbi:MAG: hypothetical protein B7Z55_01885 [Planctomycetales bacterium 12-60-4]|nr:MAG: hypothetical protein B7Z55_01885 [Planctomycetales bacterium 12-60-4]